MSSVAGPSSSSTVSPATSPQAPSGGVRTGISRVALAVGVVGLSVTAVLALAAWWAHRANEHRLIQQRVREGSAVLEGAIPRYQTPLAAAAELAEATAGAPDAFAEVMAPLVGRDRQFSSASLWPLGTASPEPVAVIGERPALADAPPEFISAFLDRSARASKLSVLDLLDRPVPLLGYSFTSLRPDHRYMAYAERALPADRTAVVQRDSAFADLDYALYLRDADRQPALLVSSTRRLPLRPPTASATVSFGDTDLDLVVRAKGDLGGPLMALLPWLIAVAGGLVSLGAALLTERLFRGRDHAQALASQLQRVADENGRLYEEQRTVALTLQHSLLPEALPAVDGLEMAVRYEAGTELLEIGGDWYDVIEVGDGRVVFVVGDVSGRGLHAATVMATLRFATRAYAAQGDPPSTILSRLGRLLDVRSDAHYAPVLCGGVEVGARRVTLASAGPPGPILIDENGARLVGTEVGVPVGAAAAPRYGSVSLSVAPRATLLAFTDGRYERRGETMDAGLARLVRRAASDARLGLDALLGRLVDGQGDGGGPDDTAILGLRWAT
jgi:serine phosphatase RsbU (regulator of sigma subunit)